MTIPDVLAIITLTGGGFVATNLDNLLILVGLIGAGADRRSALLGFLSAAAAVFAFCAAAGALGGLLNPGRVGYLGVIPLGMGLLLGWRALHGHSSGPEFTGSGSAFVLTLSNSGDSVALFVPLIAETERESVLLLVASYLLCILGWAALAHYAAGHPVLGRRLAASGRWLLPGIMIVVGTYVLLNTTTDTLA